MDRKFWRGFLVGFLIVLVAYVLLASRVFAQNQTEFPPLMHDYYQCEAMAQSNTLLPSEANECSIIYQAFILDFIGVTLEDFYSIPLYQTGYINKEAFNAFVDWEEQNIVMVESLIEAYMEILENE